MESTPSVDPVTYKICRGDTIPGYVVATGETVNTNLLAQVQLNVQYNMSKVTI